VTGGASLRRAVAAAAVGLLLTAGAAACGNDQSPGIDQPTGTSDGTATTGHFLGPCPSGGPDATTPAAGCLDKDGHVVH
jgi:hypothetical protein